MALTFADISSHNTVTSWPAFLRSVDGAVVKATQGSSYVWSGAAPALAQIRSAGKVTGAYAFAGDLGSDGKVRCGNPITEADFFLANYAWRPGEVPINDFEPSVMPADPDGWCAAFAGRVASRIGVVPWTYMNSSLAGSSTWRKTRATGSLLWVAQYSANKGQPGALPTGGAWGSYVAWQYTSNGAKPGISSPPLDLSFFYGDAAAWKSHGTPGGVDMLADERAWLQEIYNRLTPGNASTGKPTGATWGTLNDIQKGVAALVAQGPATLDPKVIAAELVAALPADQAQQVAKLVLAGLDGAKLSVAPGPAV